MLNEEMNPPHPLFVDGAETQWIDISLVEDEVDDVELANLIASDREEVVACATDVLAMFLKNDDRDAWKSALSDHWILPRNDQSRGYYTYLEFTFEDDRTCSDSWWVVVACPQPFLAKSYNVWRFGWECQ